MLTNRQKKFLQKLAMNMDPVVQIGKNGLEDTVIESARKAIAKRELIKVKIHQNSPAEKEETINTLASVLHAEKVQQIGGTGVFFRAKEKDSKIELPES